MLMPPVSISWLPVGVAAVAVFVLGWAWYGPLFHKARCRENGTDPDQTPSWPLQRRATALVCSLLAALVFQMMLPPEVNATQGFGLGFIVGLFFVSMSFGIHHAHCGRSLKLWMIDSGYHIAQFALYGVILGGWQ